MPQSPPDHQLSGLRRFTRLQKPTHTPQVEHCELCNTALPIEHHHLLHLGKREVICACHECAIIFQGEHAGGEKYRSVPNRSFFLPDFRMTDIQWDEMQIPVSMVFLFWNQQTGQPQAFYPGPAGATESLLSLENWQALVQDNPILQEMKPDVEALLINRVQGAHEYFIVPIDNCYRLVGLIRTSWRGLSGGEAVWRTIAQFFADLRSKASARSAEGTIVPEAQKGESDARAEL
jgi:Family of unknown function (DUF5947)